MPPVLPFESIIININPAPKKEYVDQLLARSEFCDVPCLWFTCHVSCEDPSGVIVGTPPSSKANM